MKAVATLALATAGLAQAGTFQTDFSTDPGGTGNVNHPDFMTLLTNSQLTLINLQDINDEFGVFQPSHLPLQASYVFPEIDPGIRVESFTATFKVRMGGGTDNPAQGFCLVFADNYDGSLFREAGGTTTGLTISFDTYNSEKPPPGIAGATEGNVPGDAPGIIIKQGGSRVLAKPFAGLRTDPAGTNHPPVFVTVQVKLDPDGTLDVIYNGSNVYSNVPIGYIPIAGRFGFGTGTEEQTIGNRDNVTIDEVSIFTTNVVGASIASVSPPVLDARPDAAIVIGIADLGGGATALQFDSVTVAPSSVTVGNITTLTYQPPALLTPGSLHTVNLTYGAKTFSYAFTVINAITIPPSAAALAGSVNTNNSGFRVRVHQTHEAQSTASAQRAEQQLAGLLGANIADLSGTNADGTFDAELINFEQNGGGAGDITGDGPFPGIPGLEGGNDNIAVEAIGYLDLQPGVYVIGGVADDSLRLSVGSDPRDITSLRLADTALGRVQTTVIVQAAGIYPLRVLYTESIAAANLEVWNVDPLGNKILLNDRNPPDSIPVYPTRNIGFSTTPYLSYANPEPGQINVSPATKIELRVTDDGTTVDLATVKLSINGALVTLPGGAVTKAGKVTTITYQPAFQLSANSPQTVKIEFNDSAATAIVRQYSFTTGKATAQGGVLNTVKGYWKFDKGNLKASVGRDLRYLNDSVTNLYEFGTTGQGSLAAVPNINGKPAKVIHIPYTGGADPQDPTSKLIGLRMNHGILPNGGGTKVNQWTMVMDICWGVQNRNGFGGVFRTTNLGTPGDADMFWRSTSPFSYGKSCCSAYAGIDPAHIQLSNEWARVVFAVDLAASPRVVGKYINGFKHTTTVTSNGDALDSRFSLPPEFELFSDSDDNERTESYVSAIQIREGRMSDEEILALGGPDANGIPLPYSQWEFDDLAAPLAAKVGNDLHYINDTVSNLYELGITGQGNFAGVPNINGTAVQALHIPYTGGADPQDPTSKLLGLKMLHGIAPNGGGTRVNQWTMVMDICWGVQNRNGFGGVFRTTNLGTPGDADMFWRSTSPFSYGKSCCSAYAGIDPAHIQLSNEWARVVFAVDLAASPRVVGKYINGFKHTTTVTSNGDALDSRFSLPPEFELFSDSDDNERTECYVSSLQIRQGRMSEEDITALGVASPQGIPTPNPVKGEWNFEDGTLKATIGNDLRYLNDSVTNLYEFGTTGQGSLAAVPNINGKPAKVIHIPYTGGADPQDPTSKLIGLRMNHGILPNGGGTKVNQWTMVMDICWGVQNRNGFGGVFRTTNLGTPGDADMFWRSTSPFSYGKSCCSAYAGIDPAHIQLSNEWARVVFAVDLAASPRVVGKYINGFKHTTTVTSNGDALDSRFSLPPEFELFSDSDDNERTECYVSAIQIREGRLSDADISALGGPDASGIPSAPAGGGSVPVPPPQFNNPVLSGGQITISWTGTGTLLESTNLVNWSTVPGNPTSPYVVSTSSASRKFYRVQQ